ncbi:MAG: hypothetical protein K0S74_794 [Chlamydiales bacterium]|nr:hypothetical protein [Chlamydiales bacterium]
MQYSIKNIHTQSLKNMNPNNIPRIITIPFPYSQEGETASLQISISLRRECPLALVKLEKLARESILEQHKPYLIAAVVDKNHYYHTFDGITLKKCLEKATQFTNPFNNTPIVKVHYFALYTFEKEFTKVMEQDSCKLSEENTTFLEAYEGNEDSQYGLAIQKYNGEQFEEALYWFEQSAKQGNKLAQYRAGLMHERGEGIKIDLSKAKEWYYKAVEQNHKNAPFQLFCLFQKETNQESQKLALYWLTQAANNNHAEALYLLAEKYESGKDVPFDLNLARGYYQKAAYEGLNRAILKLETMSKLAQLDLSPTKDVDELASTDKETLYAAGCKFYTEEKYKKALSYFEKAAELGDEKAQYKLGYMYENSKGVVQDLTKARQWYTKSAQKDFRNAQFNLSWMCEQGEGGVVDKKTGLELLKKAAASEHPRALFRLAGKYLNGDGITKNAFTAYQLYQRSAAAEPEFLPTQDKLKELSQNQEIKDILAKEVEKERKEKAFSIILEKANGGNVQSQYEIACHFYDQRDYSKALNWFEKAVRGNHTEAKYRTALMYELGEGVAPDFAAAYNLYRPLALLEKHTPAQCRLALLLKEGKGCSKDLKLAIQLLKLASMNSHPDAIYELGCIYESTTGKGEFILKAHELYVQAAKLGHPLAKKKVEEVM